MREAGAVVQRRTIEGELQMRIRFPTLDVQIVEDDKGVVSLMLVERAAEQPVTP